MNFTQSKNLKISKKYGFNFLWMYVAPDRKPIPQDIVVNEKELDFVAKMGCNFVRLPLDYRFWIHNFNYDEPDEMMLTQVDRCVHAVVSRGLHCSLSLHRAPGYCINRNDLERHNLWCDEIAQQAFITQWRNFAERYSNIPADNLSFDLLNEPPNIGQYGMTRDGHAHIMRLAVQEIRAVSPQRPITLDGLGGGNLAMPELVDLGVTMSTRGYQPMALTHYQADWCTETKGLAYPRYPGTKYAGKTWNRETLLEHYRPWRTIAEQHIPVHVGEMGIYNRIDNQLALLWFSDVLSVFKELNWGYALWNFSGPFGLVDHGRPGTRWETMEGFKVDREMYELFVENMG